MPQRIDIVQKRSDLRLVMDPGRRLEVSAVAASSNTPVTSFRAIALSGEAAAATASTQAFEMETADSVESDAETAVATIIGIGNRTRMLLVLAAGYAPAIVPVPPANVAHVEAKLDARGCQEYRVVDSAGSPVSGARAALDGNLLGAWGRDCHWSRSPGVTAISRCAALLRARRQRSLRIRSSHRDSGTGTRPTVRSRSRRAARWREQ